MTPFQKMAQRIEQEFGIKTANFERRRVGYWQRSAGAWVWVCNEIDEQGRRMPYDIGSSYSVTDLLKHKGKLVMSSDREIFPDK